MVVHWRNGDAVRRGTARAFGVAILAPAALVTGYAQCTGSASLRRTLNAPTLVDQSLYWTPRGTPSDVLSAAGVWVLRGNFIAGLEIRSEDLRELKLRLPRLPERPTIAQVLRALLSRMPGYRCWVVAPGFVNIRPIAATRDATDPLNHKIGHFAWHQLDAVGLFERPTGYFAFLRPPPPKGVPYTILGVGPRGTGQPVPDGSIENTTLLGLFNHMALLGRQLRLREQAARHFCVPSNLWSWFCIEGKVDPRTGLRRTLWSALEMAPRRPPPPPVPHG